MPKTTAGKLAIELRKLADALDGNPEVEVEKAWLFFSGYDKATFTAVARLLPRPLKKSVDKGDDKYRKLRISHVSESLDIEASIPQHLTCELIEPAKPAVYRCDPIFSLKEEEEVVA